MQTLLKPPHNGAVWICIWLWL